MRIPRRCLCCQTCQDNTLKPPSTPSSGKAGRARSTSTKPADRGPPVNKIVEGLRGDAFAVCS